MASRRAKRRRERRHRSADVSAATTDHQRVPRVPRSAARRRAEYDRLAARLRRRRTIVGALGIVPLAMSLGCTSVDLAFLCVVPRDILLLAWLAFFGTYIGLTIRLVLERRRFERGEANGRSAG